MTGPENARVAGAVRVAAVLVALVTVSGTLLTWQTSVEPGAGLVEHSAWTAGAVSATGAALAVLGVVGLAVGTFVARGRTAVVAMVGALVAVAGVATLLVEGFRPAGDLQPVTVAIARFEPQDSLVQALPDASAWVAAGGLGALAVAFVGLPPADGRGRRPGVVLAVVGAVLLLVGASALPWAIGSPGLRGEPLWQASGDAAVGAVLLLLAAVLLAATVRRPVRAVAVTASVLAALGLGALLPGRLPNPWGERVTAFSSYQPLSALELDLPPAWQFQAATTLVLVGSVAVVLGAVLVSRRSVVPEPAAGG